MLVTFSAPSAGNITLFGEVAVTLLKLMGHRGIVPSALAPEDIPQALARLRAAIVSASAPDNHEPPDPWREEPISLQNRALPLIALLEVAHSHGEHVMWDH